MSHTPKIGLTLDHEEGGGYSIYPWYAIRANYCRSVGELGAVPLPLPHEVKMVNEYLDMIDGLVTTGGNFDIPPHMYGDSDRHHTVTTKENRTAFEFAVTKGAIGRGIPILGICGGEQLLNVVLGGSLIQHVPDAVPASGIKHEQPNPRTEAGHSVVIEKNTLLHRIVGTETIDVNSAHHQAIKKPGKGVIVNAKAPDGIIEGVEMPDHPFCLGVQWHPEYHVTGADRKIFEAFVAAAKIHAAKR